MAIHNGWVLISIESQPWGYLLYALHRIAVEEDLGIFINEV